MSIQLHDRRHVVQIPTIGPREPLSTADLSVSAMLGARNDDNFSMVGGRPSRPRHVDKYPWIRASLSFTGITVERHEELAEKLGPIAAAEVLLLVISYKCDGSRTKWKKAKDLGIPWLNKKWSNLKGLQEDYNLAVAQIPDLVEEDADSTESPGPDLRSAPLGTSDPDLPPAPSGTSEGDTPADRDAALSVTSDRDWQICPPASASSAWEPPGDDQWPQLDGHIWPQLDGRSSMANVRSGHLQVLRLRGNGHHFDKGTFDHYKLEFKAGTHSSYCKFSQRIKCAVQVKQPNELRVNWLYSVPCGQTYKNDGPCASWIFLKVPEDITDDSNKTKQWALRYLETVEWMLITNKDNKRFICPQCVKEPA